jgi:hypothetical protein
MTPEQFWYQFWYVLSKVLPWFLAGGGTLGLLLLTPFGKALTRFLRETRRPMVVPPELEEGLTRLQHDLSEVLARLDSVEGYLSRERQLPSSTDATRPPPAGGATRPVTPV